jgi:hypothetical protein
MCNFWRKNWRKNWRKIGEKNGVFFKNNAMIIIFSDFANYYFFFKTNGMIQFLPK